jgi:hypothetical protein
MSDSSYSRIFGLSLAAVFFVTLGLTALSY